MNLFGYGTLAVLGTSLAAGWQYIRNMWANLMSIVIVNASFTGSASQAVSAYACSHWKRSRFGLLTYSGMGTYVRPLRSYQQVGAEELGEGSRLFWAGWKPIWLSRVSANGSPNDATPYTNKPLRATYLRWMFDSDTLVLEALDHFNLTLQGENTNRFFVAYQSGSAGKPANLSAAPVSSVASPTSAVGDVESSPTYLASRRLLRWEQSDLGPMDSTLDNAMDGLALSDDQDKLYLRLQRWYKSRSWFEERGLPWKYGALLYGPPGTGKSAFARAVAQDLNIPVFQFDLATMFNDELREKWQLMRASAPCMVLIEDIDSVFEGRKPSSDNIKLTFDALLNTLDGVEQVNGLLLIATTNRVETLDPALGGLVDKGAGVGAATRPGRIDSSVLFGSLTEGGRRKIAYRILKDWPEEIDRIVEECHGCSGAQVERRCIDTAQTKYWSELEE